MKNELAPYLVEMTGEMPKSWVSMLQGKQTEAMNTIVDIIFDAGDMTDSDIQGVVAVWSNKYQVDEEAVLKLVISRDQIGMVKFVKDNVAK